MSESRRCIAAESTSAARILRRNSANEASSIPRGTSHMRPSFSPQSKPQLYVLADAIAASFRESRQTRKKGGYPCGTETCASSNKEDVTDRRTLVVDFSGKAPNHI